MLILKSVMRIKKKTTNMPLYESGVSYQVIHFPCKIGHNFLKYVIMCGK